MPALSLLALINNNRCLYFDVTTWKYPEVNDFLCKIFGDIISFDHFWNSKRQTKNKLQYTYLKKMLSVVNSSQSPKLHTAIQNGCTFVQHIFLIGEKKRKTSVNYWFIFLSFSKFPAVSTLYRVNNLWFLLGLLEKSVKWQTNSRNGELQWTYLNKTVPLVNCSQRWRAYTIDSKMAAPRSPFHTHIAVQPWKLEETSLFNKASCILGFYSCRNCRYSM